jgi:ABC-type antimicrobial peptide transport system permease subunit
MLRNYFKTAIRNLIRQRGSAVFNIAGLTLGITASLILFLLVTYLTGFDTFHSNFERIYRVVTESDRNNGKDYQPGIPAVLPLAFREDFPEAEEVTFTSYRSGALILIPESNGEFKKFSEDRGVVFAQPNFFKIFDRSFISGSAEKGLDDPNEAVISKKLALKYFGSLDVLGEMLQYNSEQYKITGVMEDNNLSTDFPFELMLSQITIAKSQEDEGWGSIWSDNQCYFLLRDGHSIKELERRMPAFVDKYLGEDNWDNQTFNLQPLKNLHFDTRYSNYNYNTVSKSVIVALAVIAAFLIVTACINFINLTTAEAIKRSKEVGIRKTLGSSRGQLIRQFLGETSLVTLIAILFSLGLAQVALQFLNPFIKLELSLMVLENTKLFLFLGGTFFVVSVLSGLYPALTLSGYKPVSALKNQISNRFSSGYFLRKSLVGFQFFISQFFIFGTIVLITQMKYFQRTDLGFNKDAVITVPIPNSDLSTKKSLRNELERISGIEKVSLSTTAPTSGSVSATGFTIEGNDQNFTTQVKQADDRYVDLFELRMIAGKSLPESDTAIAFIVNEKLVKTIGYENPEDILGRQIEMWGRKLPVVGVVKDFHAVSLRREIEPIVIQSDFGSYRTASIKVSSADIPKTINDVKSVWESLFPQHIFDYQFLDERIRQFYEGEKKMSVLLSIFTSMAIFIGCLGLFGLATFMTNQKTKEIGVRKVLGASVTSIVLIFSKEYIKLIIIAFALAVPVSWFVMGAWLNEFAYKIEIGAWIFITGVSITILISILTVGYRSVRAATRNPVNSLRYE